MSSRREQEKRTRGRARDQGVVYPPEVRKLTGLAEMHLAADSPDAAAEYLDRALAVAGRVGLDRRAAVGLRLRKVDCLLKKGDYRTAEAELRAVLETTGGDEDLNGMVLWRLGDALDALGRHSEAQEHCERACELLRHSVEHAEMGMAELTLGIVHVRLGRPEKARDCFESALFTFRRVEHKEGVARALNNLGLLLKNGPRWHEARDYLLRALAVSEEAGNYARVGAHCLNLGILFTKLCDWKQAEAYTSRALSAYREVGNDFSMAKALILSGHLHRRRGDLGVALSYYERAEEVARSGGFGREVVLALEGRSEVLLEQNRLEEADEVLRDALALAEEVAPRGDLAGEVRLRMGRLLLARGLGTEAARMALSSYARAMRLGDSVEAGAALRLYGKVCLGGGRLREARKALEKSVALLKKTPDRLETALSMMALAGCLIEGSSARQVLTRAEGFIQDAWAFFSEVGLEGRSAEAALLLARARSRAGRADDAVADLARARRLAERAGRRDLLRSIEELGTEIEEDSARDAVLGSVELDLVGRWGGLLAGSGSPTESLERMLAFVAERLGAEAAFLGLGPRQGRVRLEACWGTSRREAAALLHAARSDVLRRRLHLKLDRRGWAVAAISVPVPGEHGVLGVVRSKEGSGPFGGGEIRLLGLLAGLMGTALVGLRREEKARQEAAARPVAFAPYVTSDPRMRRLFAHLERVADSTATILILGETGTGKGLLAECIHKASPRRDGPFVTVNCAAIPEPLLESELFGHVKGSFTGALRTRKGLFEQAEGGTLFLDEIGRASLAVQAKLLNALDGRVIRAVGSDEERRVDVRVVCASNTNLREAITQGRFLEDLYYRLSDFTVELPPLRERRSDIPLLARHFLDMAASEMGRRPAGFSREVMAAFLEHEWRGNIRELMQVVRRLVALGEDGEPLGPELLPEEMRPGAAWASSGQGSRLTLKENVERLEKRLIRDALRACGWNKTRAAERLGLSYPGLLAKMRRYGIEKGE